MYGAGKWTKRYCYPRKSVPWRLLLKVWFRIVSPGASEPEKTAAVLGGSDLAAILWALRSTLVTSGLEPSYSLPQSMLQDDPDIQIATPNSPYYFHSFELAPSLPMYFSSVIF